MENENENHCWNCQHFEPCAARQMLENAIGPQFMDYDKPNASRWLYAMFGYLAQRCKFFKAKQDPEGQKTNG